MSTEESSGEDAELEGEAEEVLGEESSLEAELVEEDLDELSLLVKERDEYRAMVQRLQADFENYKKRVSRQGNEAATRVLVNLVGDLLPVLDALANAKAHIDEAAELSLEAQALLQARNLLVDTLTKKGLEVVPGQGEAFDPQVHDAVAHAEGDEETTIPLVDEVLREGYAWQGTVVRPAMVRVKG